MVENKKDKDRIIIRRPKSILIKNKSSGEAIRNNWEGRYRLKAEGYTLKNVAKRVGEIFHMSNRDLMEPGKQPNRVRARSVLAYWAVQRGRGIVEESGLNLERSKNA